MSSDPFLEIQLHLANGRTHRFAQNDSELAQRVLDQVEVNVFSRETLVIYGEQVVHAYSGQAVVGISLIMDPLPDTLFHFVELPAGHADRIVEITEEEYQVGCQYAKPLVEGLPGAVFHEAEMISGQRFWTASHVAQAVSGWNERSIVHHAFSGPVLGYLRRGGGVTLWNRAQLASYTFSPKPDVPVSSWPAARLPE